MKAPDWYPAWRHDALHMLIEQQEKNQEQFKLGSWPRYDYEIGSRTLTWSADGVPKVVADIQVVGTVGSKDWLWGWANDHWPHESICLTAQVREYGLQHEIEELTAEYLAGDDLLGLGWELSAVTARILNSQGAYLSPSDHGGGLFLVYDQIRWIS